MPARMAGTRATVSPLRRPNRRCRCSTGRRWRGWAAFRTATAGTWESVPPAAAVPSQPLDAAFADGLRLEGVTLPATVKPGETLDLTLYWRADAVPALDSSVFVQLLDAADKNVAQWDWPPYDAVSKLPASSWPAGWRGEHALALPVPEQLPAATIA